MTDVPAGIVNVAAGAPQSHAERTAQSHSAHTPQSHSERSLYHAFALAALLAGLAAAAQVFTILRARHELTQVESIVATHARMLVSGEGLYYDLQQFPFTVSPYGPLFYSALAALQLSGLPVLLAGRLISLAALVVAAVLCWRLLMHYTADSNASLAGILLLASTANLLQWGTVGQVDMLALCFSLAAFEQFSHFERTGKNASLARSGVCIALAIFTKQTFLAAGAAVTVLVLLKDRRRGLWFAGSLGAAGLTLALALDAFTSGRFLDNAVRANLNPFSAQKAWQHLQYFLTAAAGLLALTAAGFCGAAPQAAGRIRTAARRLHPFHVYLAFTAGVMALTAPKVGSDLNYQIETMTVLCLCAGWSLHRLRFFPLLLQRDRGWVTLLQIPLLLHLTLNLGITAKAVVERYWLETIRRLELAALRPYLRAGPGRVLSVQIDPLLQTGRRLEVEPLIYTLLVDAGVVDPEPLRDDLAKRRFALVILYQNLFAGTAMPDALSNPALSNPALAKPPLANPEVPSLPAAHLREIRRNYRLVAHVPGPLLEGDYLYAPLEDSPTRPRSGSSVAAEADYSQRPIACGRSRP